MRPTRLPLPTALLAATLLACAAPRPAARPAPAAATFANPIVDADFPDPTVIRASDGRYYAYGTQTERDGRTINLQVMRSRDLVHWEQLGDALPAKPAWADSTQDFWAPHVSEHGGTFYLYYSMGGREEEKFEIRVATSDKPQGPYADAGVKLLDCDNNRFTIDPHPFKDADGQWYMFYARNYPEASDGAYPGTALAVARLAGMTKLEGECRTVVRARYPWTLYEANRRMDVYGTTFDQWHTIEGAFVRRHRGRYYCFYSGSNYQTAEYGVDYVVADSVLGPYTGQGTEARVLKGIPGRVRGPGHHSIVVGPDGKTEYIVYHAWDPAMKVRQLCIDKLRWTPAGPRTAGPTFTPQPLPGR